VNTADIANSAVTQAKLAASSVGTSQIINGNVTQAKVANGYVDLTSSQTIGGTKTFTSQATFNN